MPRFRKNALTATLATALAIYHLSNLVGDQPIWKAVSIDFSSGIFQIQKNQTEWDSSRGRLAGLGYALRHHFGELPDLVLAGPRDPFQRLYLRKDLCFQFQEARIFAEAPKRFFREALNEFKQHGVRVIVLPIPTKLSIERSRLADVLPEAELFRPRSDRGEEMAQTLYGQILEAAPHEAVDLYTRLAALEPEGEPFVPWDYHLSSRGIAEAALAVTQRFTSAQIVNRGLAPRQFHDRLLSLYQLPSWWLAGRAEFQWQEPLFEVAASSEAKLRGKLILAGTSYSDRLIELGADLGRLLARSLSKATDETRSCIVHGGTPDKVLHCVRELPGLGAGDVLVWEFPIEHFYGTRRPLPSVFDKSELRGVSSLTR